MRKFNELSKNERIKTWNDQPDKIIKQRINIRRLKLRVKRRLQREKKIQLQVNKF